MKIQHLKNEFKKILTRYVQYKYTFFSRNRFIHAYLMICVQTVKMLGAKQKYGIQNITETVRTGRGIVINLGATRRA